MHEDNAPHEDQGLMHVLIPAYATDPRGTPSIPGVTVHRGPPLHPDDVTMVGLRRLPDPDRLCRVHGSDELRAAFARAQELGLLDPEGLARLAGWLSGARLSRWSTKLIAEFRGWVRRHNPRAQLNIAALLVDA
jgi:hypothetical protein